MTGLGNSVPIPATKSSPQKKWGVYVPTLAACGVVLLGAGWPYRGFFIAAPFLVLLVWLPWNLVRAAFAPARFVPLLIKSSFWIATFAIVLGLNQIYEARARRTADSYARAIEQYKAAHGAYPRNLEAAGLHDPGAQVLHYYLDPARPNDPMLMYRDTFTPFDRSYYDFGHRSWEFHPD